MRRSFIALAGLAGTACAVLGATAAFTETAPAHTQYGTWGVELSGMDKSVRPGDNFFMFVNGGWYKNAVIPPDRASTGSFQNLRILSETRMNAIAASLDAKPYDQLTDDEKKLRDLYDAYLDQKQIDANGLTPAKKDLDYIAGLKTLDDVAAAMGDPLLQLDGPMGVGIGINEKDPNAYAIDLGQSGLGMPDRDYYLKDDPALAAARDAYKKHLAAMFTLAGLSDPDKRAQGVFDLEVKMAQADWPNEDRRNEDKVYNPMSYSELKALTPQFPWDAYFKTAGISTANAAGERQVIVAENSAFPKLSQIFADTPVDVWRDYLTAHYLHTYAAYLPKTFDDEDFAFFSTTLQGVTQQLPRTARGASAGQFNGRSAGQGLCREIFPARGKGQSRRVGEQSAQGL
jgi:predicted metalloendopeptidase